MPQLLGEGTAGSSHAKNSYAYQHDTPRFPTVAKTTGYWRHEAIDEEVHRQHHGGTTPAPTKLVQNGGEKDREGVPDAHD